ncbi:hypothetical protein C7N43_28745 [Sphingobacteriales bacterium UPWRP_1]|nr:hypothetical protein BVG80_13110 [Sphingobacteriales bacterium TSM_CSM]PSJ73525.1 hypothetical protein C7N43_28745 [Sphingobacteriales bacterium UPWRP_1]
MLSCTRTVAFAAGRVLLARHKHRGKKEALKGYKFFEGLKTDDEKLWLYFCLFTIYNKRRNTGFGCNLFKITTLKYN